MATKCLYRGKWDILETTSLALPLKPLMCGHLPHLLGTTVWLSLYAFCDVLGCGSFAESKCTGSLFTATSSKITGLSPQNLPPHTTLLSIPCDVDAHEAVLIWFQTSNESSNISDPPHQQHLRESSMFFPVMRGQFMHDHHFVGMGVQVWMQNSSDSLVADFKAEEWWHSERWGAASMAYLEMCLGVCTDHSFLAFLLLLLSWYSSLTIILRSK